MAYSDYGAFVRKDGERRRDKEDDLFSEALTLAAEIVNLQP